MGERSNSGPGDEGGGEAILAVTSAETPVLSLGDAMVGVVGEDMLLEARKGARGDRLRGGATRTVKGGWLVTCVVTRGAVAEVRWSYTEISRWGMKGAVIRELKIRADHLQSGYFQSGYYWSVRP